MNRKAIIVVGAVIVAAAGWYATRPITVGDIYAAANVTFGEGESPERTQAIKQAWALAEQCGKWPAFRRQCLGWYAEVTK